MAAGSRSAWGKRQAARSQGCRARRPHGFPWTFWNTRDLMPEPTRQQQLLLLPRLQHTANQAKEARWSCVRQKRKLRVEEEGDKHRQMLAEPTLIYCKLPAISRWRQHRRIPPLAASLSAPAVSRTARTCPGDGCRASSTALPRRPEQHHQYVYFFQLVVRVSVQVMDCK